MHASAAPCSEHEPLATLEIAADILRLVERGDGTFRTTGGRSNHNGTIFGGRLIAQSLAAATATVAEMPATSLHAYFLAAGQVDQPVDYHVTALRDSRRFANRMVEARQSGVTLFTLMAQFHAAEEGFLHQHAAMPDVPPPEAVMPLQAYVLQNEGRIDLSAIRNFKGATPIEMRPVDPDRYFLQRSEGRRDFWFRLPSAAAIAEPRLQQCLLAYASDYWLGGVSAIPHVFPTNGRELLISSLDHALWFHRPVRCEDWLLHHTISPAAGDGLGFARGQIFDRHGRLVASSAQECLLRRLSPSSDR
ncbi:acyl-CoA thioesterase-2 [Sphingomonas zeicaulis]|uniref:acyl-CoA thioesterase n=1 Tax=Sphingomonas zeicaulis TaxID=1632740 RepID=UPI003D1D45DE